MIAPAIMNYLREIRWRPEIGDPSLMGWLTVFAYALGAVLAARVWIRSRERLWLAVSLGMTLLCVNKQLDLQSLFTDIGRIIAWHQGWIERRREVQKWFVLGIVAGSGLIGCGFVWRFHSFWQRHKLLSAGVIFLITFIVVRAISFHHFDSFLKVRLGGVKMNWALELGGIAMICTAAFLERSGRPRG